MKNNKHQNTILNILTKIILIILILLISLIIIIIIIKKKWPASEENTSRSRAEQGP